MIQAEQENLIFKTKRLYKMMKNAKYKIRRQSHTSPGDAIGWCRTYLQARAKEKSPVSISHVPTNLGQPMHSQSVPNLAPFLLLYPVLHSTPLSLRIT